MKKAITLLLSITVLFLSCKSLKNEHASKEDDLYKVFKLDSINDWYLIYALRKDTVYKIVSHKENNQDCELIRVGSKYKLSLKSMTEVAPVINGVKMVPMNYLDISHMFDENTAIRVDNGSYDLYFTDNIKGLCFVRE